MEKNKNIPVLNFEISLEDDFEGVKIISFVDAPAIESDTFLFNKTGKKEFKPILKQAFSSDGKPMKNHIAGLVMRADYPIYRIAEDEDGNQYEYYVQFSEEQIVLNRDRYHKYYINYADINHNQQLNDNIYMIENFIIDSEQRLQDVKQRGIKEAKMGDWFAIFKCDDKEIFQKALDGELNGFSVDFGIVPSMQEKIQQLITDEKNNFNKIDKEDFMGTIKQAIAKFAKAAKEFEAEIEEKEDSKSFEFKKIDFKFASEETVKSLTTAWELIGGDDAINDDVKAEVMGILESVANAESTDEDVKAAIEAVMTTVGDGISEEVKTLLEGIIMPAEEEEAPAEEEEMKSDEDKKLSEQLEALQSEFNELKQKFEKTEQKLKDERKAKKELETKFEEFKSKAVEDDKKFEKVETQLTGRYKDNAFMQQVTRKLQHSRNR